MERKSFWPKTLPEWVVGLGIVSLLLIFVFGSRMFFVSGALISLGFLAGGLSETVRDIRKRTFRKHPLLMAFDLAWRAGPLLLAGVLVYVMVGGIFGRIDTGHTVSRLIMIAVYLFGAMIGVFSLALAFALGRMQPGLIRQLARQGKYSQVAAHVMILAMCAAIPALVTFFAWRTLRGW